MQLFNDFSESTEKRETMTPRGVTRNKIFSDEENHGGAILVTEDDSQRKTRSVDTDHQNINRKYKLDNMKISKEFTSDVIDSYIPSTSSPSKPILPVNKIYESDASKKSSSDGGGQVTNENNITVEDDEEFLYYNNKKKSIV